MAVARPPQRLRRAYWSILGLGLTCIALLSAGAYLVLRHPGSLAPAAALEDPEVRGQLISRLVADNQGIFDSHADADVGRVHLPGLRDREFRDMSVSTNRFGMRERDYALPKPDGVVRVVLLGDSMVFGLGVAAEDRLGVYLEQWLEERASGFEGRIECLHLGVSSWNVQAAAAYLRRQLSDLRPDLVIHVVVPNDIEDAAGARGFGVMASFSTQRRKQADAIISAGFPSRVLGIDQIGLLRLGLDYEPRTRYRAAAEEIRRLAQAVERAGGKYRLLVNYRQLLPIAGNQLTRHLDPEWVVYLSPSASDPRYTLARGDAHWNRSGHALIAQLIYGLILRDGLLPRLQPAVWEEASAVLEEVAGAGRREAERDLTGDQVLAIYGSPRIAASLDVADLDSSAARQIHGGIDRQGRVSPYASLMLRNDGGQHLRIAARAFRRPELEGARVRVFVDADKVGEFGLEAGKKLALSYRLPAAVADRPYVSVRFEAEDYIYKGRGLRHCVVFWLHGIAVES